MLEFEQFGYLRPKPIVSTVEEVGDEWLDSSRYTLADFFRLDVGRKLKALHDYVWNGNARYPVCLDTLSKFKPELSPLVAAVLSVDGIEDPWDYRLTYHRSSPPGVDGDCHGKTLAELAAARSHYDEAVYSYLDAKCEQAPQCHVLEHVVSGVHRYYARIIWPCFDVANRVVSLLIASIAFEPNVYGMVNTTVGRRSGARRRVEIGQEVHLRFRHDVEAAVSAAGSVFQAFQAASAEWPFFDKNLILEGPNFWERLQALQPEVRACISVIDVTHQHPDAALYVQHSPAGDMGNVQGLQVGAFRSALMRLVTLRDIGYVKRSRVAMFDEVHHWRGQRKRQDNKDPDRLFWRGNPAIIDRHYNRLSLPLCKENGGVSKVLMVTKAMDTGNVVALGNLAEPLLVY